ncbi:hypothetical protein [Nocardioides speluncae]|uniref:hypothetical protein n=1 Tax=Nocardioides speluncae TaxID=2670337 RepID=UPI0012B168DF|nr:hypothetical protein [Nocardioides speluncae]
MPLTANLLPPLPMRRLAYVVALDRGLRIAGRPLPFGSSLPSDADHELRGLGYRRLDSWASVEGHWRCDVQPTAWADV